MNKKINKINWNDSVWFFDIDDTLIDTEGASRIASKGIEEVFASLHNKDIGKRVRKNFESAFNKMLVGYRITSEKDWKRSEISKNEFESFKKRVFDYQKPIIKKWGVPKKWSREIFIKIASEGAEIKVAPETIHEAADAYWITLTENTKVFSHARDLIKKVKQHKRPVFLITSSDARLKMRDDGQFEYDPEYSEALKRERIMLLREQGIDFDGLSIGDPEDKPGIDFFEKAIRMAESVLGNKIRTEHSLMFGDSFAGDLQTPKEKLDFGLVILFEKKLRKLEIVDKKQINTGNLTDVLGLLRT